MRKIKPVFKSSGMAVCYLRVSSAEQKKSQIGLMAQSNNVKAMADLKQLKMRDQSCDSEVFVLPRQGYFVDEAVSAYRIPLDKRPAGSAMLQALQRGDTLIVSRLDRAFRSVADFLECFDRFEKMGVRLILCQPNLDLGTASGRMQAQVLAVLAEWESRRRGERIKAALAAKKQRTGGVRSRRGQKTTIEPSEYRPSPSMSQNDAPAPSGTVYPYIRCSHRESLKSGLGLLDQLLQCRKYAEYLQSIHPNLSIGRDFTDAAVSAMEWRLVDRPMGSALDSVLKAGDHVVIGALDRGFRSVSDMSVQLPKWIERGIHVHFVNEGISTDDPTGAVMATIICSFAEMEANLISDRCREARAQMDHRGRYAGGMIPSFWRVYEKKNKKRLVLDRKRLISFRLVEHLRHFRKMSTRHALIRAEELLAKHDRRHGKKGRPAIPLGGAHIHSKIWWGVMEFDKHWPRMRDGRIMPYITEKIYRMCKIAYPNAIETWRKQVREAKTGEADESAMLENVEVTPRRWQKGTPQRGPGTDYFKKLKIKRDAEKARKAALEAEYGHPRPLSPQSLNELMVAIQKGKGA